MERNDAPLKPEDIAKIAIGQKKATEIQFNDWELILSDIIISDVFGVDRIDYLLRDAHHIGVAYGKFDHYRLIDTIRILPTDLPDGERISESPLGVEHGGLQTVEALLMARYLMYSQVYFHRIRRIYDIHLRDFLKDWLSGGQFITEVDSFLKITDNDINTEIGRIASDRSQPAYNHARRLSCREHFEVVYEPSPEDREMNPEAGERVFQELSREFGEAYFRHDRYSQKGGPPNFPVLMRDDEIQSARKLSEILRKMPIVSVDYVFSDRGVFDKAEKWLRKNRQDILQPAT